MVTTIGSREGCRTCLYGTRRTTSPTDGLTVSVVIDELFVVFVSVLKYWMSLAFVAQEWKDS